MGAAQDLSLIHICFRIGVGVVDDKVRRVPAFGHAPREQHLFIARRGREAGDLVARRTRLGNVLGPARCEVRREDEGQQQVDYLFHACFDFKG